MSGLVSPLLRVEAHHRDDWFFLLLDGLIWPCPFLPFMTFPTETAVFLTLFGDSGLCFVSLSFALIFQMFPKFLPLVLGDHRRLLGCFCSVFGTRNSLLGKSKLDDRFRMISARRQDVVTGCVLGGLDFWPFNPLNRPTETGAVCWLFVLTSQLYNLGAAAWITLVICVWAGAEDCWDSSDFSDSFAISLRYLILPSHCLRHFLLLELVISLLLDGFIWWLTCSPLILGTARGRSLAVPAELRTHHITIWINK